MLTEEPHWRVEQTLATHASSIVALFSAACVCIVVLGKPVLQCVGCWFVLRVCSAEQ